MSTPLLLQKMAGQGKQTIGLALLVLLAFSLSFSSAYAENRVHIDIAKSGSSLIPYDTIYVGGEYEVRIWVENDYPLGGIQLVFKLWSDNGVTWRYVSRPDGYGPQGIGHSLACITVTPGSRLDPPEDAFDMTGLLVTEQDMDMIGQDKIGIGGVALLAGLESGPDEHMISWHFSPTGLWIPGFVGTLCLDTAMIPPGGFTLFINMTGGAEVPLWGGAITVPVKLICGNPNGDNDVNVGDVVFLINHIFRDGPAPVPWQLGDANVDGAVDVGDVVFLIAASFRYGPQPECP
jgi:hypothetical protein